MASPLISIGIPAYNHAAFIKETIESALNQSIKNIEIIIVDDASTDDTAKIASAYVGKDPRVKFIQNEKNLGPAKTTEILLANAEGKYFSPVPSDDFLAPDKYEKLLKVIEADPEMAFVFNDVIFVDENSHEIKHNNHFASGHFDTTPRDRHAWLRYFFNAGNCVCASGPLIRRDILNRYKPDHRLILLHDYDLWVRMSIDGFNIGTVDEKLSYYRILDNQKNLSAPSKSVKSRRVFEHFKVLKRFSTLATLEELSAITKKQFDQIPEGVSEKIFVQHQLSMYAWEMKRAQYRNFAIESWYEMLGDSTIEKELNILSVNPRFLAERMESNPLVSGRSLLTIDFIQQLLENFLPGSIRCFLVKKIKKSRGD
ncbi:glycosyltransferase [Dickeya zeae]|uniref:Glycosyltransferase n=1 Tax=Dickeya zeae TaxID=204042 RepID=A0AAE6Z1J8_9GAMM|nr:glycosyltransferase [Dickeya zeae]QIZ52424.1 glycosyltransferase [Dickeya zeae]